MSERIKQAAMRSREDLAEEIVDALFRTNFGDKADRIALKLYTENGEKDLGGRNRSSARHAVLRVLEARRVR